MSVRKTLRTSLEDLAIEFAKSLVAAVLSGSANELREVFAQRFSEPVIPSVSTEPSPARARAPSSRRRRATVLQGRSVHPVFSPQVPEAEPRIDAVIIDPDAMLRSLAEQQSFPAAPTSASRHEAPPAVLLGDVKLVAPPPPPTRQPNARNGEEVLRAAGGGFVLRRTRGSLPVVPLDATVEGELSEGDP